MCKYPLKRTCKKYGVYAMVEQVEKRNKSGNIKPLTRQQLINIVSNSWSEVPKEIVIKGLSLQEDMEKIICL